MALGSDGFVKGTDCVKQDERRVRRGVPRTWRRQGLRISLMHEHDRAPR